MSRQCSQQEVLKELERLLASKEFAGSHRAARFLRYIVERTLADDRPSLKEAVIGTEVFDRPAGYDPKAEPIVRTEARRLRTKLDDAYLEHPGSGVRISVPKGSYVAMFEESAPPAASRMGFGRPWSRRALLLVIFGVLLMGGVSSVILRLNDSRRTATLPVLTTVTAFAGGQYFPSLSPDQKRVAFVWQREDEEWGNVYVSNLDGGSSVRLTTDPGGDVFPVFSPDGTRIAFIRRNRGLMTVGVNGGEERFLTPAYPASLTWSPDGKQIVYSYWTPDRNHFALFSADPQTGAHQQITDPPSNVSGDFYADFSPDSRELAFARCAIGGCSVLVKSFARGSIRELARDSVRGLTWSPDGGMIVFCSKSLGQDRLWRIAAHGSGQPQPVAFAGDGALNPRFGRDHSGASRLVFEHHVEDSNIWRIRLDPAAAPARVIASTRLDSSPQISPDGNRIVFVTDRSGFKEIWVSRSNGSDPRALTELRMEAGSPRWSPDGRRVAFDLVSPKGRAIFVVNADGGVPQQWTAWAEAGRPSWSRDGRWIYFGAMDSGGSVQVFKAPSESRGTPLQVTRDGAFEAFESMDGKTLFYIHDKELRRMPTEGGAFATACNREIRMGTWGVAANGIFFVDLSTARFSESVARGPKTVYLVDPSTGASQMVASITGDFNSNLPDFCVSPDGKTLYYSIREVSISQIRMMEGGF